MPDFTVHEGGKGRDDDEREKLRAEHEAAYARQLFGDLVIKILRTLARGDGGAHPVGRALIDFREHNTRTRLPVMGIIHEAMLAAHRDGLARIDHETMENFDREIISAGMKLAAESMALDSLAAARASKGRDVFRRAIEDWIVEREARDRKNGWSYVGDLTKRELGKWSPPRPEPKAKSVSRKKRARRKSPSPVVPF